MRYLTAIPVYNEERHVEGVLDEVRRFSPEILVINDGSTDRTAELLARQTDLRVLTHPHNRGYGAALISAFAYALEHDFEVLVTMDCDGQHEPARIPVLLEAIHDADIVSGSRYLRDFRQDALAPQDRRRINLIITTELNQHLGLQLTDTFCGFKAYRREALARLHITETGWGMPLQLWVQAARARLRIKEVAVPRLYLDPTRTFGGTMDDAEERLAYYRRVIQTAENERADLSGALLDAKLCAPGSLLVSPRRGIHAPTEDGALVADPPLSEVGALLHQISQRRQPSRLLLGRPLHELQAQARQTALGAARTYLARLNEPLPEIAPAGPLLLAGHQPELFHPGVWVKNFALARLARAHGGSALNLVVDNDQVKSTFLRLPHPPTREQEYPYLVQVPFDRWPGETPIEEWTIQEPPLFRSFADRAGEVLAGWGYQPLLPSFWAEVCRVAETNSQPGTCFASARRGLERRWGCHNLEVPLSVLCDSEPFAWFACDLLGRLPHLHATYNRCVAEYRRANRIRSRNHPVPNLTVEGDFLEVPLWGWRSGQKRRSRLLVRQRGDRLELRAGGESWPDLPIPDEHRMAQVLEAWRELQARGYRIRTRALSTTLFSRLLLADLFMHGIGGGKYDEVTDAIARRFYEWDLPGYLVLSATKLLPLPSYPATAADRRRLVRDCRDVRYNPERFLDGLADVALRALLVEKRAWQAQAPGTPADRRERFRQLRAVNDWLHEPLHATEQELQRRLETCERELAANTLLRRRDYAFCLYPEEVLRPFCTQLLRQEPEVADKMA